MLWKGLLRSTTKFFYNYWGWSAKNGEKRTSNVHSKPRTVLKHTLSGEIIIIFDLGVNFKQNCRNGL